MRGDTIPLPLPTQLQELATRVGVGYMPNTRDGVADETGHASFLLVGLFPAPVAKHMYQAAQLLNAIIMMIEVCIIFGHV